jgi:hypothetical protein
VSAEAAVGSNLQGVPFRDQLGHGVPSRSLQRKLAAPCLSLHVRPRVHGWLPGVFCDRGWLQRLRRAPRAPRRRDDRGLARPDRRTAGLQAPHGLDVHVGIVAGQRLQLRFQHVVHRGAAALRQSRLQLPRGRHNPRLGGRLRGQSYVRGHDRHRRLYLHSRGAGHECVRTLRRRHLPHLLHLRARSRRALGDVPVARPGPEGAQRDRAVVSAA